MARATKNTFSRRDFLKGAAVSAALGPFFHFPARTQIPQKTLKIAKWAHFLPEYDSWFEAAVTRQWGELHATRVLVEHIPVESIHASASGEIRAGKGHDVFMFPWPPAEFHQHTIDHAEVYQSVAFKYGVLDPDVRITINTGARTIEALKYAKALYQDAGTPEQLNWPASGNVHAMLARKTSCSLNGISLLRTAELQNPQVASKIRIQPPLLGSTGTGVFGLPHVTNCSVVWNFAENREGAKQFLADLIDNSKAIYEKSRGCNFPLYQKTVPDLIVRLENDATGDPPFKYKELKDALHWTHNLGFPSYATPVSMEVFNKFVIPRMFISVAKGELRPEEAARMAEGEITKIAEKWKQV